MGIITDIKKQVNNKNRVSIFVDNEFLCGLDALTVAQYRLVIGEEVDEKYLLEVTLESEKRTAFDIAMRYISVREHSVKEVRKHLEDRDFRPEVIKAVIEKLEDYGYCDDYKYCTAFVSAHKKKMSRRAMRSAMRMSCDSREAIDEALSAIDSETETAIKVSCRYVNRVKQYKERKLYKLRCHLFTAGFEAEDIDAAVEYVLDNYWQDLKEE